MGTRALHSGGRAKSFGTKGATATCPKCCGLGCCVCADPDAQPGDPCYSPLGNILPCNTSGACCCGSRLRVEVTLTSAEDYFTYWHKQIDFDHYTFNLKRTVVFDLETFVDPILGCQAKCSCVHVSHELHELVVDENGVVLKKNDEYLLGCEDGVEKVPCNAINNLQFAKYLCRPEPGTMVRLPLLLDSRMRFFSDLGLGGDDYTDLFDAACNGRNDKTDGKGVVGYTEWKSTASCKRLDLSVHSERFFREFDSSPTGTWDMALGIRVQSLDDNCCPDDPNEPGDPYNPAPPVVPGSRGNPGFVLVPWAGINWRGIPAPLRWWKGIRNAPGCGCMDKPKGWWEWLTK